MNKISTRQNEPDSLRKLSAQRQIYSEAKLLYGTQITAVGPLAVALAIVTANYPQAKEFGVLWSVILLLVNTFWISPLIKRWRTAGAVTQEMFDCHVLEIPWSKIKVGTRIDAELLAEKATKFKKRKSKMPTLTNWYAPAVSELTIDLGRIACQRTNCWWDRKQRQTYATFIAGGTICITVAVLFYALLLRLSLSDLLVTVIVPLTPLLAIATTQYLEQQDTLVRLDSLKLHCEKAWSYALTNGGTGDLEDARAIQDEIFDLRRRSPFVFDFIFKRIRGNNESLMKAGISELVQEAKQKLKTAF